MRNPLHATAVRYQRRLPGIVRAALVDEGIAADVVDRRRLGWDGEHVTVPVHNRHGRVVFIERWDAADFGSVVGPTGSVELYPWSILECPGSQLLLAEGVRDALILESQGYRALAATGSGRFFKSREWGDTFRSVPEVVIAYRRGERRERRRFLPTRSELRVKVQLAVPSTKLIEWPKEVGPDGGPYEFFVHLARSRDDFDTLISEAR